MKVKAIVYTSNTGFTAEYARMVGEKTGLPVYRLEEDAKKLDKGTPIIYFGWLFASSVKGYKKAAKRFDIKAVCGVGLGDTGEQLDEVRRSISLPTQIPLFTLQGGMKKDELRGMNKFMINVLAKSLSSKAERSEKEERMVELLTNGGDYVSEDNIAAFMAWYNN